MATNDKNQPGAIVLLSMAVIVLMIIFYFILLMYFPELFQNLEDGKAAPVAPN